MCPLLCCFFMNRKCCCNPCSDDDFSDDDDIRRSLLKSKKSKQYRKYYSQKRSKPQSVNNKHRRNPTLFESPGYCASPIIHSGLRRLPFNGTLSDLTERSEEENSLVASSNMDNNEEDPSIQFGFGESNALIATLDPESDNNSSRKDGKSKRSSMIDKNVKLTLNIHSGIAGLGLG